MPIYAELGTMSMTRPVLSDPYVGKWKKSSFVLAEF